MCYKSKETSRCEIVQKLMCREMNHKLMCCQIGKTLIYRELSHNLTSCSVDHKLTNVDRNEGFFCCEIVNVDRMCCEIHHKYTWCHMDHKPQFRSR